MDKKKLLILGFLVVSLILLIIISSILLLKKPEEKPIDEVEKNIEEIDYEKIKEVEFEERVQINQSNTLNEDDVLIENKKQVEELEKDENVSKEVIDKQSTGGSKVTVYGDNKVTFTPGGQSADVDKIKEERNKTTDTVDLEAVENDINFVDFEKEVTIDNKLIIQNLPLNLDYKTLGKSTYVFDKVNKEKIIFVFDNYGSKFSKKGEFGYFLSITFVDRDYLESSKENKLNLYEMIRNSGYKLTDEELNEGIDKAIKDDGNYFYYGDYSFATGYDNTIKISKIN